MGQATATADTIAVDVEERDEHRSGARPELKRSRRRVRSMRGRMARILALPLAVVVVLLGLVAAGPVGDYRESQRTSTSVGISLGVQALVGALQDERGLASLVLGGNESFTNELVRGRQEVDSRRRSLAALVAGDGAERARVRAALQTLDGLAPVRASTDSGASGRSAAFAFYTARIAALSSVDVGLTNVSDRDLARSVALLRALQDAAEATAQERALLSGVFSASGFGKGEFIDFATMRASKRAAWERYFTLSNALERTSANYVLDTGAARTVTYFENVAAGAADGRRIVVNPQTWWSAHTTVLDGVRQLQEHAGSVIRLRAYDLQREATLRLTGLLVMVIACIAGSIWLAVLAALSVSRPLSVLATEAETVATERLPAAMQRLRNFQPDGSSAEPVPPKPAPVAAPRRASAEIRSVVAALNLLQEAAYRLAVEQAMQRRATMEALTNLGRRNQNLVRKQLRFISNLEKEEMDPTGLANLFELDHLATRMRRNASSLLVLTGSQTPGQWSTPAPIVNVMRAAISEVEDYRRVALRRVDETLLSGAVIAPLAHLLSELIENGLRFSPPDTEVEVVGRQLGDDYLIAVVDQGIGMSPGEVEASNARLRGEGDFMVSPSRFLGHFVVGRLAEQAGVRVELLPSPVTGVTARIHLPGSLLVRPGAIEAGQVVHSTDHALPAAEETRRTPAHVAATESAGFAAVRERLEEAPSLHPAPLTPAPLTRVPAMAQMPAEVAVDPPLSAPALPTGSVPVVSVPVSVPAASAASTPDDDDRVVIDLREDPLTGELGIVRPASSIFNVPAPPAPARQLRTGPFRTPAPGTGIGRQPSSSPEVIRPTRIEPTPGVPGVSAPTPTPGVDVRTRNGLRVRVPGSTRTATSAHGASGRTAGRNADGEWPPPAGRPILQTTVEESAPARLGSRLSALRSGLQRGFDEAPADDSTAADAVAGPRRPAGTHWEET